MHGNLSAVQKRNNQSKEAIANASEALRLNPRYLKVRIRRAELYEETDSPHESLEDWKEILEQEPSNKNAKKGKKILGHSSYYFENHKMFYKFKTVI